MQRQYVHLSIDVETATRVGKRRDPEPVILKIDTEAAQKAGIQQGDDLGHFHGISILSAKSGGGFPPSFLL